MPLSTIGSNQITDGAIAVADVADGSITTAKLADNAVTTAKITDGNITTAKVADDAITGAKIENTPSIANGLTMTDGDITFANGHGISFSATSDGTTMSSELFDDYEEGAWSPTLTSSSGASRSVDSQVSRYTKIGRICYISCEIGTIGALSGSNSGTLRLGGLPFNYNGSQSKSVTGDIRFVNVDLPSGIVQTTMLQNSSGTSNLFFFSNTFDLNNAGELGISSIGNTSSMTVSLVYEVA